MFAPTTMTFLWMNGTELYGTTMSTSPFLPKPASGVPVSALSAIRRRPAVKIAVNSSASARRGAILFSGIKTTVTNQLKPMQAFIGFFGDSSQFG